jgi:hypothetical protein
MKDQAFVLTLAKSTVAIAMHSNVRGLVRQPPFTVLVLEEPKLASGMRTSRAVLPFPKPKKGPRIGLYG